VAAVHPVAAVSTGLKGQELVEMAECAAAGAVAFSDDGAPVATAALLRRALDYAGQFGRPVIDHCEDRSLAEGGQMNEGFHATRLGLKGIPAAAESAAVARDLLVAEISRGRLHVAHVSTAASVRLIREAKARGLKVSAETCPHYLVLTEEAVGAYDTQAKMNPPLRTAADRDALWEALRDGTIDAVATDHAPHSVEEKDAEFDAAPFGILGLETAVGLLLTHGVRAGRLSLADLVRVCSAAPRAVLGLPAPAIAPGAPADLTLLAPDRTWTVDRDAFLSKSRNTPFHGWTLHGAAAGVVRGERMFLNP
jgi:dihydroorotase